MKKILMITVSIILIAAIAGVIAGCSLTDELAQLKRAVSDTLEASESLDEASPSDLNTSGLTLEDISSEDVMLSAVPLYFTDEVRDASLLEKIGFAIDYLDEVKNKQIQLEADVAEIRTQFNIFKENVKNLRAEKLKLSEEEKDVLSGYIGEVKELKDAILGTIGMVYVKIKEARQNFGEQGIDGALNNLSIASNNMTIRVDSADRICEIITSVNDMLQSKLNPESQAE